MKKRLRVDPVRQAQQHTGKRARDESDLHAAGQPGRRAAVEVKLQDQRRDHSRSGEPQRHGGELAERKQPYGEPFGIEVHEAATVLQKPCVIPEFALRISVISS